MTLRRYIAPARVLGSYRHHLASGAIGALSAGDPVVSFRNHGLNPLAVRRVLLGFACLETPFISGQFKFELVAARAFTLSDSGGTAAVLTGNNGKLKTGFQTTDLADFRISSGGALTAGTRTLDNTALSMLAGTVGPSANVVYVPSGTPLFAAIEPDDWPIVLEADEGFIVKVTVPVDGSWCFDCGVDYQDYALGAI